MSKKYTLAPYVSIGLTEKSLKLGFGSLQSEISNPLLVSVFIELCYYLTEPRSLDKITSYLQGDRNLKHEDVNYVINLIIEKHLLVEDGVYDKSGRYSRQMLFYNIYSSFPQKVHNKIQKAKIIICGCGGIGSNISVMLATMGIKDITLIDDDVIELSNLSRQFLYSEEDIGKHKVDILQKELLKRDSTLNIKSLKFRFSDVIDQIDTSSNLIVLSGDSFGICSEVNSFGYAHNIPFINIGYIIDIAVWGPFIIPGETPCYECFSRQNISNKKWLNVDLMDKIMAINSRFQAPSVGPVNSLALSYAGIDIMKYLGEFGSIESMNKRVGIWTNSMSIQLQDYCYMNDCTFSCKDFKNSRNNTNLL